MSLFAPIFDALNRADVRNIVVGGVAVILQGHVRLTVDLFVEHPFPFEKLWQRSQVLALGATKFRVASIPDLLRLKELSGRSKNLGDIHRLKEILKQREERK